MGIEFDKWLNNLPQLAVKFVGMQQLMSQPNPGPAAVQAWQELMAARDAALNEVVAEYQNVAENAPPFSYPWLDRFIRQARSIDASYPGSGAYLQPVARSFLDLARFKLASGAQGDWRSVVNDLESLVNNL